VKIALYDLMRHSFDYHSYPGIYYPSSEVEKTSESENNDEIVKDLEESLKRFGVKLAAAFARIRIERRATGNTVQEQMANILPEDVREKETIAGNIDYSICTYIYSTMK
jgi:hypothetical protein